MKTIPPTCPEPQTGRTYWRSLDELAETPEFREWMEREFPQGASEWTDPVSRRHFVKIMSASFLLAGLGLAGGGCRRPEHKILPFGKGQEGYVHGVPEYYATAMPTRAGAVPLVAKAHDGRPVKVEGNAQHPDSNGGTDRWTQASILNLYDPDRARRFTNARQNIRAEQALDFLGRLSARVLQNRGQGLSFLVERTSSPSRHRLQTLINEKLPNARWYLHEPVDTGIHRRAATAAFDAPVEPRFRYDQAKVIVSLDCDFIGAEEDAHANIRRFAEGRRLEGPGDTMSRLYVVEALMTLTGVNADHRLRLPASAVGRVAQALLAAITGSGAAALPAGVDPRWIAECAKDLQANRGASLVVAGHRQPQAVHLLAHAINAALDNLNRTVVLHPSSDLGEGNIADLARALNAGEVNTLVMIGALNPVYTAPADLNWAMTQRKAQTVVRLGHYEDETFPYCDWHLPAAHYLESWGDARSSDGTMVAVQPLIAPLFGGVTELEVLARIAGESVTSPYDIVRETFARVIGGGDVEGAWRKFLFNGFLENTAARPVSARLNSAAVAEATAAIGDQTPSKESIEVIFHRDYSLDDGRYSNNGWLQELPDPVTKITWDNVVLISRRTARELGVKNTDVVEIRLGDRTVSGPIWIQPGMADDSIGLALGYGREGGGRVGEKVGFNAYALRTTAAQSIALGATLRATGGTYPISCTQDHWSMEGRPIVREANLGQYREHPDFAKATNMHEPPIVEPMYPNPLDKVAGQALHQWGMSIDLNACVGCTACVLACQSENNVPIVGKDQVKRGREMQWLRIDRYYAGDPEARSYTDVYSHDQKQAVEEWIDEPQVVTQPMLCQHCEAAPCENVCPVNATVHDHEGLNLMVYNRCVGTRYCSNNCPYKVRRFNYFDYNKRPINDLYLGPLAKRPKDELDLAAMVKNPEVTVRMRGVMEKCTFCIQRIESAKIAQKVKAGASGDVVVPEGTFTTACAQACPAGAIVFGNLKDPESRVSRLKQQQRDYTVLEFLLTKPRLTYLAKVRNPNPAMPDYRESPLSLEEYKDKAGIEKADDPFEHHGPAAGAEAGAAHGTAHGAEKGAH